MTTTLEGYEPTGVFLTEDEAATANHHAAEAISVPVMMVGVGHNESAHDLAVESFKRWVDALAVSKGLPPLPETQHYALGEAYEFLRPTH